MKLFKTTLFLVIAILISNGNYAKNKYIILATNKSKPRWVQAGVIKDRSGHLYFKGQAMSRSRRIALSMARANAQVIAARYFYLKIGQTYKEDLKEKALGVRASSTRIVHIRGLLPVDSYIEEIAVLSSYSKDQQVVESLIYKAYVRMKIDKGMLKYVRLKRK